MLQEGGDGLAESCVLDAHDDGAVDGRVCSETLFDLEGIDVLAACLWVSKGSPYQ